MDIDGDICGQLEDTRGSLWIFVGMIFVDLCGSLWIFVDIASSLIYNAGRPPQPKERRCRGENTNRGSLDWQDVLRFSYARHETPEEWFSSVGRCVVFFCF